MATVLNDIGAYKEKLLTLFSDSADIRECLLDGQPENKRAETLRYQQIFPYLLVDISKVAPRSYISVEADIPKIPNNTTKDVKITIWIYCHKDIMTYEKEGYSGTRVDILADMADRQINESGLSGIGTLRLVSALHIMPGYQYHGIELIYHVSDFRVKR